MPEKNTPNVENAASFITNAVDFLFSNPGRKIKSLSLILFVLSLLGVLIAFFSFLYEADIAFVILIAGTLGSYISCLFLMAFGELVENSNIIAGKSSSPISFVRTEDDSDDLPEL